MSQSYRFRLNSHGLLLAAISAAFAHSAFANSGRVDFASGNVTATSTDGNSRQLVKGNEVKTGDRIISDASGRAQIRFSDGSFVSLQPNTDFDIKNYAYDGKTDGTEKALFNLFKGAMRTVTGLIGRRNRDAYQLTTPTATIGIRGTGGVISVGSDGSTLVLGTSGVWTLTNPGGSLEVPAGKAGAAGTDPNKAPQQTSQGPNVPAPQGGGTEEPPLYSQGESRNSTGSQTDIPATFKGLVSGSSYAVAEAFSASSSLFVPTKAIFNSTSMMTSFDGGGSTYTLGGTHAEFATVEGVLAWGRWIGTIDINGSPTTYTANQGLHYVVGIPTPAASLPTGVTYTYNMIGATSPTTVNGSVAPGTLTSATLTGNFSSNQVGVSLAGSIGGKTFDATVLNIPLNTSTASFNGSAGYLAFTPNPGTAGTLNTGSSSSGIAVNGFFSGSGATNAGFSYMISNTTLSSNVVGAVALKR